MVVITLKQCGGHSFFFFFFFLVTNKLNSDPAGKLKVGACRSLKSLLSLWGPNQLVNLGLLSFSYKFIWRPGKFPITQNPNAAIACNAKNPLNCLKVIGRGWFSISLTLKSILQINEWKIFGLFRNFRQ